MAPPRFALLLLPAVCVLSAASGRELSQIVVTSQSSSSSSTASSTSTATATTSWLPSFPWPTKTASPIVSPAPVVTANTVPTVSPAPVVSPTSPATTASVPTPSGGSCPDPSEALNIHNSAHAARGARPLAWSTTLAQGAQAWASNCRFQHSGAANLGESLYWSSSQTGTCDAAARMWAAEAPQYAGSYSSATGHWNQMVWKATTAVGCGAARCGSGTMVVCRYSPQGNVIGSFAANV